LAAGRVIPAGGTQVEDSRSRQYIRIWFHPHRRLIASLL